MKSDQLKFCVPATLIPRGKRKPIDVNLILTDGSREDARWQAHHGVLESGAEKHFPGHTQLRYSLRRMRQVRESA